MKSKEKEEFHDIQFKMFNPKCKGEKKREGKAEERSFLNPLISTLL